MRILFTTHPAYGHFHPLLLFAEAARDAGHDVKFATSAMFAQVIEATGFPVMVVGLNWLESDDSSMPEELRAPPGCTLEVFFAQQFVTATAAHLARDVAAAARTWAPDVIVRERTEFGGSLAADLLGIPCAAVQVASPSLMTPELLAAMIGPYNAARTNLGLAVDADLSALEGQVVFACASPSLHDPAVPLPRNFVSLRPASPYRHASSMLPEWAEELGRDRPLVYATLGTVFNDPEYELPFFPAVIDGLRSEAVDVLITVGPDVDTASIADPPTNVRVERYVSQGLLFPRCSAIVCHGGYGTLLAAVEHGVPVVIVPFGADQHINARSVERLSLGLVIQEDDLTAERMREAVRAVLHDPVWRRNVARVREEGAALPAIPEAVSRLEELVRQPSVLTPTPTANRASGKQR